VLSVAPETFARLAPGIATGRLQQFTNVADPLFTPLAIGLRRATMLGAPTPALAMETLAVAAVERVSVLLDAGTRRAKPERRMTSRRLKRILDHFEARLAEDIRLADLASNSGLSESSRPHVPGGDRHDAARGAGRAADRTRAFADRSCLVPRRPRKPRGGCGRDRLLKPRPYDDGFPPCAWHHSERMDASVCQPLTARTNRSQHRQLTVAWLPGERQRANGARGLRQAALP
jgi:hypothetical protein